MLRQKIVYPALAIFMAVPLWAGQTYTREDAVRIAMEKSSDIKTAEEDLVQANSEVEAGFGNAYPTIDFDATMTRIFGLDDVKNTSDISDAATAMGASPFEQNVLAPTMDGLLNGMKSQGYRWQTSIGLTATQILYAQGKVTTGIAIAKSVKRLREVSLENAKSTVRYNVETSFDQLIYLDSAVGILEASIALTQSHIDYVAQAHASGLVGELDMVRAQLQLDELQSDLDRTKKNQIIARNALLNTMGLEFEADVQFTGNLRDPEAGAPYPDTSMANVKKRRKELVMLQETENMQEKNIGIEQGDYKPLVVIGGQIAYTNNKNKFYQWDAPNWDKNINKAVFLNVSMNLFNGMKTRENVAKAKSSLRSTQIQKETAERGFRLQIESCANTLTDAEGQLSLKKRSVELAQKNYDLTEAAYKVGKAPQLDLLDANMSLRNAKLQYMEAVLNWNNAYNALLQATGEF